MTWWMARLVRLYPRRWRERHEAELAALIEESGADWYSAVDVVRGATLMQLAYGASTVRHHARRLSYPTSLDDDFTVVWWDQRGSGLSSHGGMSPASATAKRLVSDAVEVTHYLRTRFGQHP